MKTTYQIEIEGNKIGTTQFEYADVPMGVIYGKIIFEKIKSPYEFLKNYCVNNDIKINMDDEKLKLIDTVVIPNLKVYDEDARELIGWGGAITGIEDSSNDFDFEIQFGGITSEIMKSKFQKHFDEYFGKSD